MDVLLFNASYGEGGARENIVVNIFIIDKIFVWKPRRRLPRFLIYAKRRRGFWGVFRSEENRDSELIKFDTRRSRNIEKGGPKEERRVCYQTVDVSSGEQGFVNFAQDTRLRENILRR